MSHKSDTDEANVIQFVNYNKDKSANGLPPLNSANDLDSQTLIAKVRNGLSHKKRRKFTLEEIGYHFRLSRQTVSRHLNGALEKLEESGVGDILENIDKYALPSDI